MFKYRKNGNSFKLGVLSGIFSVIALDNAVGLVLESDFRITRLLLLILFGTAAGITIAVAHKKM